MAAKNVDPLAGDPTYGGVDLQSIEAGVQDWAMSCGICHVGGGITEYDRDMNSYDLSTNTGDTSVVFYPGIGPAADPDGNTVETTVFSGTNKAEMDCLMCHIDGSAIGMPDANGRAWLQTKGCNDLNPIGPRADRNCDGDALDANEDDMMGMSQTAAYTGIFAGYDSFNRNEAIKNQRWDFAASMGVGAIGTVGDVCSDSVTTACTTPLTDCPGGAAASCVPGISGIDWGVASPTLDASVIAGVPKSANCAPCHARVDMTMGLPGMAMMKFGFGQYFLMMDPGTMLSQDELAAGTGDGLNDDLWIELGCKTGMGKRTHKVGLADPQGDNQFTGTGNPMTDMMDMMANYGASGMYTPKGINVGDWLNSPAPGVPGPAADFSLVGQAIPGIMPDIDVHDRGGMSCGTCHYKIGAKDQPGTFFEIAGDFCSGDDSVACTDDADCVAVGGVCTSMADIPAGEYHHLNFPGEKIGSMDHMFAQGDSFPDTKGKNNLDEGVSCESCHITRTHPNSAGAPTPSHDGYLSLHFDKIACSTCHIPEVYAPPARLKYRDWTVGVFKGGNRHTLDWNFNLGAGNHKTMPVMKQWLSKFGETKIYPVLSSVMPIWVESITNTGVEAGSDSPLVAGDDPFRNTTQIAPVKQRDNMLAAKGLIADGVLNPGNIMDIRLDGGNMVPFFDGFQMPDAWEIDTAAELEAMVSHFQTDTNANVVKLKLFQANFDVTHGIVPPEWALGGSERGGCVSCHSSADPANPNYSPYSMAFFEGSIQPLDNAVNAIYAMGLPTNLAVGSFDPIKNWFSQFADFDCTQLCMTDTLMGFGWAAADAAAFDPLTGAPQPGTGMMGSAQCDPNSPMHNMVDTDYMCDTAGVPAPCNPMDPSTCDDPTTCAPDGDPTNDPFNGGLDAEIGMCVSMMQGLADAALGVPGFAAAVGMNDGVAGLQGFLVRESAGPACDPLFNPGGCIPADFYTRGEIRSHMKIDLQQSCPDANPANCRVTWPVPGAGYDAAQMCQDQGVSTGNPFAPATGPCCGVDNICGNADDVVGMDGQMHIAARIPGHMMLGYANPDGSPSDRWSLLTSLTTLTGAQTVYNPGMHLTHGLIMGATTADCTKCHTDADANSIPDNYEMADAVNNGAGSDLDGDGDVDTWTYTKSTGNDTCAEGGYAVVETAPGVWEVQCIDVIPGAVLDFGTCNASCHQDRTTVTPGNATADAASATGVDVTASVGAIHAISDNNIITANAQRSSCTGAYNSECTYAWFEAGCIQVGGSADGSVAVFEGTDGVACVVSVDVTDTETAETVNSGNVTVTSNGTLDPTGPINAVVASVNNGDGSCTVTAGALDGAVHATIYWGNRENQIVDVADLAGGVTNYCGANVRITLIDAAHAAATLNL